MKIKCSSCHKQFDNEKYYGICPKCGAFNKLRLAEEEHMNYHDMYDGGNTHSEYDKHEKYHEMYDDTTSHAKVSTGAYDENGRKINTSSKKPAGKGVKSVYFIIFWFVFLGFVINFIAGVFRALSNFYGW